MRKVCLSALVFVLASTAPVVLPQAAQAAGRRAPTYYVSLGDSYSVGYQPGIGATPGYTVYVASTRA